MNQPTTALSPKSFFGRRVLPSVEYMAENAYIPPGFHRLLSAGGLTAGLWTGRTLMDVITARNAADGSDMTPEQAPVLLRPLYGLMRYNPYSDAAADRWKSVADKMVPMLFGGLGAWAGSRHFFYGKTPLGDAFHPATNRLLTRYRGGEITLDTADSMAMMAQANVHRNVGAGFMTTGSALGTQLFGALFPFTNGGGIATGFQVGNRLRTNLPGFLKVLNPWLGNRGGGSRSIEGSLTEIIRWGEANIRLFGHPKAWVGERKLVNYIKSLTQNFEHVSATQKESITKRVMQLMEDAHTHARKLRESGVGEPHVAKALNDFLTGHNASGLGFAGEAYERLLLHSGFDLGQFKLAYGQAGFISRALGSAKAERVIETRLAKALHDAHGVEWGPSRIALLPLQKTTFYGLGAAGIAAGLTAGGAAAHRMNQRLGKHQADDEYPKKQPTHWINGKPLDIMQWISRVMVVPPSMHRFMNAAYFSAALWGGMKLANVLAGRNLSMMRSGTAFDSVIAKADAGMLKSLHGLLTYNPGSVAIADRIRQAAHYLMPVSIGMFGTYAGSAMFFRNRSDKLNAPKTLEDYADKIAFEQSKPFAALTAATSIFNTGSGIHLLPVFNYSANLHNRYLLASGQQVAMPGIGQWWSGNAGLTPWGIKRSLDYTVNYLSKNPAPRPVELPSLIHSVLGKLYPQLSTESLLSSKQVMLNRIYAVRDSYLVNGTIPETKQPILTNAMQALLRGEGLEQLLQASGLNPNEANLKHNGASGKIANFLGKGSTVKQLEAEYRQRFSDRAQKKNVKPMDYLKSLADHSPANDAVSPNFAARIRSEDTHSKAIGA